MKYTEDTQFIEEIRQLVGKKILFKLTDEIDDEGLIGILKQFNNNLIIERDGLELVIELYELYNIEEYRWNIGGTNVTKYRSVVNSSFEFVERFDIMQDILVNDFKKELIVYGVRPDLGAKAVICKTAKDCLALGKKVLFYSFELPEEVILKRINAENETNLLVKSGPLKELNDMKDTIESFKPDIVFIDYFQLMTRDTKSEDIHVLNTYAKQYDIPFIILSQISSVKFKSVEFNTIDLEEAKEISPALAPIIDASDRFIIFYDNGNKEYLLKELKNSFGETKTFDIRDLLN